MAERSFFVELNKFNQKIEKPFKTIDEQIQLLKDRNLLIEEEQETKNVLINHGYYKIINGYGEVFEDEHVEIKRYKEGTTFLDIYSQFYLDQYLSNKMISSILDTEEKFKTISGYIIAKNFGIYHQKCDFIRNRTILLTPKSYLDKSNYGSNNSNLTLLDEIYNLIQETKLNPISFYRNERNQIPPWILFSGMEFGKMNRYFQLLKTNERREIFNSMIPTKLAVKEDYESDSLLYRSFFNILELLRLFRNSFAHNSMFATSSFKQYGIGYKLPKYLNASFLLSRSEQKSGMAAGTLYSLMICLILLTEDEDSGNDQINNYKDVMNIIEGLPNPQKTRCAFFKVSNLPTDFIDRLDQFNQLIHAK